MEINSIVFNEDCISGMKRYPDKYFDLAICDPPYGIEASNDARGNTKYGNALAVSKSYGKKDWDKQPPSDEYFSELIRVSKNQIIWGANHFISKIPYDSSCWVVWDKNNGDNGYADCELAWTSFDSAVRKFKFTWAGMLQEDMKNKEIRVHPTQKPVALYKWLLDKYAKAGDKILDPNVGSGSSRVACSEYGFDYTGFEIDKEYFEAQEKRYKDYKAQMKLF